MNPQLSLTARSLALLVTLVGSLGLAAEPLEVTTEGAQLTLQDLRTFTDVFEQLRRNYIEEIDDATLLRAAIRGMVSETTDAYSAFIDEDEFLALDSAARGEIGGIGAEVVIRNRRLEIQTVFKGSPAEQAEIRPGDLILAVDGQPVKGRELADSIDALQGEPGSAVTLQVESRQSGKRELELIREKTPAISVRSEWARPDIAYLEIGHFHQDTHFEFHEKLMPFLQADAPPLAGIILDLRGNLGGTLQSAVAVADGFLDDGMIVNTRSRYPATQLEFHAHPGQWAQDTPLVVLVDGSTASASEVLAGALKDHGRARIIGQRTYGKGSIQSILHLRNGSALKLTTALYFTPSGRSLQGQGIEPDVTTGDGEDARDQALAWLAEGGETADR